MKLMIYICMLTLSLRGNLCQDDLDLDALIANTFNTGSESTTSGYTAPRESPSSYDENNGENGASESLGGVTGDCECVPYYQCSTNRTFIEDGEGLIDIRIKTGPCDNYLDVCCGTGERVEEPITPSPPSQPTSSSCGQRNPRGVSSLRITGDVDSEAQFGEFPWMVAVISVQPIEGSTSPVSVYQCGGSLISPSVVLTAAHCVYNKTSLSVRAGEWDTQTKNEPLPIETSAVRDVVVHEQFNSRSLHNDVALLLLETPIQLAPHIGTICLPEQGESMDGRQCVASGWGKDVFGAEGGIRGKDTCKGDGGSPLACPSPTDPQVYVQAGIVAWGIGCGTETPGVYVNVPHFRNWIDNKFTMYNIDLRQD